MLDGFLKMFDWTLSTDKRLSKNQRRLTDRDAQAEDRQAAAEWLLENGEAKGLRALLTRFDMSLTHQLNDKAEKEFVFGLLAARGKDLAKPLRVHLKKCRQFALPIRLLEEVEGEQVATEYVYKLLEIEFEMDDLNNPDKKKNMLVWLTERRHPGATEAAKPFIDDFDEGVRHAAMEVVITQSGPDAAGLLEARMVHPEEDSNRLRVRLCQVFIQRGWSLSDPAAVEAIVPLGYQVSGDRIVST
jgi:hypothetical protein